MGTISASSFEPLVSLTPTAKPWTVVVGDVDGDGKPDIVAANIDDGTVTIFKNESTSGVIGTSAFSTEATVNTGGGPLSISIGDMDGDGFPDLIIANEQFNEVSVFQNINDTSPPVISNPLPANVGAPVGSDVTVSVTVTDPETNVDNVDISFGPANAGSYAQFSKNMTKGSNNVWSYPVPKDQFKDSGLQYEIGSYSTGGYNYQTFKIGLTYDNSGTGLSIPYSSGTAKSSYRIIALPLDLNAKTVNDVFSDETSLGTLDKTKWRIYHYTGGSNQEMTGSSQIKPGEGYWFIAAGGNSFDTGKGNTVGSMASPVTTPVVAGWNQIGNPYTFNVSVDSIINAPDNAPLTLSKLSFKTYAGSFTTSPNQLDKYQGAFMMVGGTGGDLTFPAEKSTGLPGNGRTKGPEITQNKNPLSQENWEVMLNLSDSKQSLNFGGFGMHPQASATFDRWDDFTVPRFLEYLELDHAKKLYGIHYTKDMVPTAGNYEWTFDVESSQEGTIEMNWDNTYFGENDKHLILWDVRQQIPNNMREQNKYTIDPSVGTSFKVFFGDKDYVKEKALPDRMVFHSVFPNPSDGKFTFAFSTTGQPEDKWVSLDVVDILGRKVRTITEGDYAPGYHEVSWDAVDSSGSPLAGGIYLTRLKNAATEIPKKIILK